MQIKKLLMTSLIACGVMSYAGEFENPFAIDVEVIDQLDMQKFKEYHQQSQLFYANKPEMDQFQQRIMGKFMVVLFTVSQEMSLDELETKEDVCKYIKLVCRAIRQDNDFTSLVQRLVDFAEQYGCKFVDQHYEKLKEVDIATQMQRCSWQDFITLFKDYIPQGVDVLRVYVDWYKWQQGYYMQQIEQKGNLEFIDTIHTAHVLGEMLQLPKLTMQIWLDLIEAVHKGFLDLPQDLCEKILQATVQDIKNSIANGEAQKMEDVLVKRQEFAQLESDISNESIKDYAQLLDDFFAARLIVDQAKKEEMLLLQEKIIFKN